MNPKSWSIGRDPATRASRWPRLKIGLGLPIIAALALASVEGRADYLSNGDFQAAPLVYSASFNISANLDKWTAIGGTVPQYTLEGPGPSGVPGDLFAKHRVSGDGQDEKLVQLIDATGIAGKVALNLDYIYEQAVAANSNPQGRVSIIGIQNDRSYTLNGGTGTDGVWGGPDFAVALPDILLAQAVLPYSADWQTAITLVANVPPGQFAYLGVVVQSGCYDADTSQAIVCDTLRGVDNFVLIVDEEGPYTKHVEGVPNAAVFGTPFTVKARVDDSESGNTTINAAEYRILRNGTEVVGPTPMDAADGAFDMPFEDVSAVHMPGLPVGRYEICVRGQDMALNWGEESCSNFVTYSPISQSGVNLPISNECAIFYTLENPGAENQVTTLRYGESIVFDSAVRINLDMDISPSGKVSFNYAAKANGQGIGVTSGIRYNFMLNSVLRAKADLADFDPSTLTFNVRAKIVGQPQEIDGIGILNGAQNNAELFFKLRLHYANGYLTHDAYDFGVECVGDPWSNLMEAKDLDSREPVTRGFGDDWNKYAWSGADFNDALIVATKNAWYDIATYIGGDGGGPIDDCVNNPPLSGGMQYPEIYWRFACLEIYGSSQNRDSNGAQIWRYSYKNKRWQLVYDARPTFSPPGTYEYIQGFRDAAVHDGKLYIAGDRGAFISGVSYETPGYFPGVTLLVSRDGISFDELTGCPQALCGGAYPASPGPGLDPIPMNNGSIRALASHDGKLWIGTLNNTGGEVWSYDGTSFSLAKKFGPSYPIVGELEPYGGKLYIGLGGNLTVDDGANNDYLWVCDDCGSPADDFAPLPGLPDIDPNTMFVIKLFVAYDKLFAGTVNFENGFSFMSYDAAMDSWDIIVDGPNDGGMFDPMNIYLWSGAGPVNGRMFIGTFNPATITELPRGTAELWYSDDGVNWTQYPMPIGWSLLGYGIRNMVVGDGGKSLFLLSATNMVAPDIVEFDNPLRAGLEVWQIRDTNVASPSGGASKGKGKGK